MVPVANCFNEGIKCWQPFHILWEGIPLHNDKEEKGVFVKFLRCVDLAENHREAIFGHMSVGLDIFWHRDCHKSVNTK